ncbi:hypothetical protein QBC40DRAFT_259513 [Triangularia verruculosa]|uniref:Uncharacterized protein n=1 Tax=Triangularia verruculosa TaxID=2587418 RepID=A0AAN6X6C0_9PEZI|nr:hypothetical protein QBC40DRAFT_259513 [Triangularia verruculosa]
MFTQYSNETIGHDEEEVRKMSAGVEALAMNDSVTIQGAVGVDDQMFPANLRFGQLEPAPVAWDDMDLSALLDSMTNETALWDQKDTQSEQSSALQEDNNSTLGVVDHPASKEDRHPADWTVTAALEAQVNPPHPGPTHRKRGGKRSQVQATAVGQAATPSNNSNRGGLYPAQWDITAELQSQIAALTAEVAEQTSVLKPSDNRWIESERKLLALLRRNRPMITHQDIHDWFIPRHSGAACESDWSRQKKEEALRRA